MSIKPAHKPNQLPIILYEAPSDENKTGISIPYIEVPKEGQMPPVLFIFEYKHTGEFEPDEKGNEQAIVDQLVHKYCDLEFLQAKLGPELNDQVRVALGMKPLAVAKVEGQKIMDKVMFNIAIIKDEAEEEKKANSELIEEKFKGIKGPKQ